MQAAVPGRTAAICGSQSLVNGGIGIEVFAHDPKTGDGVIPYPYALLDELHRHPDMRLWELWAGKLRKRGAQILGITTAGEPETPFENMRDDGPATGRTRGSADGSHLRAAGARARFCTSGWSRRTRLCGDMAAVKAANPLSTITVETLARGFRAGREPGRLEAAEVQPADPGDRDGDHRQGVGRRRGRRRDPGRRGGRRWGWTWRGSGTRPRWCRCTRRPNTGCLARRRFLCRRVTGRASTRTR